MKQTEKVKKKLIQYFKSIKKKVKIIIKPIKTIGDKILDKSINQFGGKGIFTKELDEQLLNDKVDICVHSLKDVSVILPDGITISCFLKRDTINDVFLSLKYKNFEEMNKQIGTYNQHEYLSSKNKDEKEKDKEKEEKEEDYNVNKIETTTTAATVATSSLRRMSQIKHLYKNIQVMSIRGNINTRLLKLFNGYCDTLILALCGLERLVKKKVVKTIIEKKKHKEENMNPQIIIYNNKKINLELLNINKINKKLILPALCQGIIAVTAKRSNSSIIEILKNINDETSEIMAKIERSFLSEVEGNCMMPVGGYTEIKKDKINFHAIINDIDGSESFRIKQTGNIENYSYIGKLAAEKIKEKIGDTKFKLIKERTERYYKES